MERRVLVSDHLYTSVNTHLSISFSVGGTLATVLLSLLVGGDRGCIDDDADERGKGVVATVVTESSSDLHHIRARERERERAANKI